MANDVEVKVEQQTERPRRETHGNKNVLVRFCEKAKGIQAGTHCSIIAEKRLPWIFTGFARF